MDATYSMLAHRVLDRWTENKSRCQSSRLIIALAGPPGSGKTTIAHRVVREIHSQPGPHPKTVAISADGFHLPLSTLRAMPNAEEAIARRGAPWTFDARGIVTLVRDLVAAAGTRPVTVPTFDHEVKDPVADGLVVGPDVEVCIVEGNYLLVGDAPWGEIGPLVDDRWLVKVDPMLARMRVAHRHLKAGIEDTMDKALARAEQNDMVNGQYVAEKSEGRYDISIESIEES